MSSHLIIIVLRCKPICTVDSPTLSYIDRFLNKVSPGIAYIAFHIFVPDGFATVLSTFSPNDALWVTSWVKFFTRFLAAASFFLFLCGFPPLHSNFNWLVDHHFAHLLFTDFSALFYSFGVHSCGASIGFVTILSSLNWGGIQWAPGFALVCVLESTCHSFRPFCPFLIATRA